MTDIQKRVLQLLKEIDEICRNNGIEYFLAAGSAIGAVRHHGFLPWDDDADIYMTYDNFKKFCKCKEQFPDARELITIEDDYSCGYLINRYADISTTRLYRYLAASPQPAGLIVDILVLDRVPDDEECIKDYKIAMTEMANVLTKAAIHTTRIQYDLKDADNYKSVKKSGLVNTLDDLKKKMLKYDGTSGGVLIQRDPIVPHVWKEEFFGKPRYVAFEDTVLPVPEHYYDHLCGAFDEDWMYVPDMEGREQHWSGVIIDISNNNPFNDYLDDPIAEKTVKRYDKYHKLGNLNAPLLKEQNWERLKLTAVKTRLKYSRKAFNADFLMQAIADRDIELLDDYFEEYSNAQVNRFMLGGVAVKSWLRSQKPFYIEISDDFLYIFVRFMLMFPKLGKVMTLIKARLDYAPATDIVNELVDLTSAIKKACRFMEEENYREALELTAEYREKYEENMYLQHLYFSAKLYLSKNDEFEELLHELSLLPEPDRYSDVNLAVKAEVLSKMGQSEKAAEIYSSITDVSMHGLLLNSIYMKYVDSERDEYKKIAEKAFLRLGNIKEEQ